MEKHIEIIDGQEVIVKVYLPNREPKKWTASNNESKTKQKYKSFSKKKR